jgi:uncharacterized membrane protein YciS (DUF1049 family)
MRGLSLLFLLVVLGALVVLGYQNDQSVTLTFLGWAVTTYLWVIVAAGYLLGMLSGWTIASVIKQSWRRVVEPTRR